MFCVAPSMVDDEPSAPSTPKASKKKQTSSNSKNPYSQRGLDKFSSVVSELEAKREKILSKMGTQGATMIRFMSSNSKDWVPIVVRMKEDGKDQLVANPKKPALQSAQPKPKEQPIPPASTKPAEKEAVIPAAVKEKPTSATPEKRVKQTMWRWKPSYYTPAMTVLVLLSLVMFGRVFAICCTSIWWYLMPTLKREESRSSRKKSSKKESVRRPSDKRLLSAGVPASQSADKKL